MRNIEKYLRASGDQFSPYGNGVIYKNDDAFKAENDEICYISEGGLDDIEDLFIEGKDLTDNELIEQGIAESYSSIIKQIIDAEFECNLTPHEIAEYLYYNADWAYISTYIMQIGE